MGVVYILGDAGLKEVTKIGYSNAWETRYEQIQSHNPRGIRVHSVCVFSPDVNVREIESECKRILSLHRRVQADGSEWFDLAPEEAYKKLDSVGLLNARVEFNQIPKTKNREYPYDDWRSMEKKYDLYKRILWVFQEESPEKSIKIIHSPLYNTCYTYKFTYNPFKVYLVAAYHHPLITSGPSNRLMLGNEIVANTWEHIVKDKEHGPGLYSKNVGWLKSSASVQWVHDEVINFGLVPYDLKTPKPKCMFPKEGRSKFIEYEEIPSQTRVRMCGSKNE